MGLSDYMFHHNRLSRTRLPLYPKESFMAADLPPFDPVTELGSFEYPVGGIGELALLQSCADAFPSLQMTGFADSLIQLDSVD